MIGSLLFHFTVSMIAESSVFLLINSYLNAFCLPLKLQDSLAFATRPIAFPCTCNKTKDSQTQLKQALGISGRKKERGAQGRHAWGEVTPSALACLARPFFLAPKYFQLVFTTYSKLFDTHKEALCSCLQS